MAHTSTHLRLFPGIVWRGTGAPEPDDILLAAAMRLPSAAVFSGPTAAWLIRLRDELTWPIEATVPPGCGVAARSGMRIRRVELAPDDVVVRRLAACTSVPRTLADLAIRSSLIEVVVDVDAALNRSLIDLAELGEWVDQHPGQQGVKLLRGALHHAEPLAESPMETRLRVELVMNRLPRPVAQQEIRTPDGQFAARVDLAYPEYRIAIEYDGKVHRERLAEDNRRQNRLLAAGYEVIRFAGGDLPGAPAVVRAAIARKRQHLERRFQPVVATPVDGDG